ncbi:ComEC/Rec2 family competence protein [Chryseobacterium indoltheticum]|uniref:ComEC family competence protein n=1 Tax=Chryseobacterium indoltheticum TaxID=254 RepID=A0A381JQS3_9FLAO|nr:ComEC/Rec2 family competence protein [Chryseobacterium indoltheticum]AZA75671.1 ComEC family competence protein [Chryseobacterium indoltheticum]SIQ47020.1 competence protein ComEC [Chryseobacterium indoltheticum]SUY53803.1 ComEC family competence protein [Chryseobacterium indoltheticum]
MILNKQPLLIVVLCFILGIFFQDKFFLKQNSIIVILFFSAIIFGFFFLKSQLLFKIRNLLLMIFFFGLGVSFHFYNISDIRKINLKTNETVIFKISKKLNSNLKFKKYEASIVVGNKVFDAIVNVEKAKNELDFNHYYKAKAYLAQPKSPEYDFQFDYSKYLKRKNIFYQCYINGEISSGERSDLSFTEKIKQKRLETLQKISNSEMSFRSREFLKGIILADRTEIDSETVQDFNRSGLVHFLAISGTHIVVIFGMFYFLMMRFSSVSLKKYAIVISLLFIWIFAVFIGFGNSVVRSCIMISVYFIYVLLQRKPDLLHSMALSAFIILMIDTQQIFDVGFQLSFIAVLGIYWLNQPILKYLPRQNNFFKKLIYNTISISVAAQLATLPLVLYYFHQFSLISIVANFIIVPFSELIIIFSFFMTALIGFNVDIGTINLIYDFIINILLKVIHWFADFDAIFFENIPLNLAEVFVLFGIIYFLKFMLDKINFRTVSNVILAVAVFFIVRVSFNIIENQEDEFLVHHYKKENIISMKKGNRVIFWMKSSDDKDKIQQYIINPYVSSRRIKNLEIKNFPASAKMVRFKGEIYELK